MLVEQHCIGSGFQFADNMGIYSELNRKDVLMNIKDEVKKLTPVFFVGKKTVAAFKT